MKLLLLTIRGLQASLVGAYGNHWVSTPTLDALADRGILFDAHYANVATPEGARQTWLTGRVGPSQVPNLLQRLREADVPTMLVHDVSRPLPPAFLAAGWSASAEVAPDDDEDSLDLALQGAMELLDTVRDEPHALVWLDLPTLLPPWQVPDEIVAPLFEYELVEEGEAEEVSEEEEPPEEEVEEEEDLDLVGEDEPLPDYVPTPTLGPVDPFDQHLAVSLRMSCGAAVNALDAALAGFFRWLEELDPKREMTLVVTSDHGLPLGEHGMVGLDGAGPHEELLHLPLIIRLPGEEQAGRRVAALCQSIDLAVTLAELFSVALPDAQGTSLLPWLRGSTAEVRPYLVCQAGDGGSSLRTPDWTCVAPGRLYLQPEDSWEVNDIRQHHLELAEHAEVVRGLALGALGEPGPLILPGLRDEGALQAEIA